MGDYTAPTGDGYVGTFSAGGGSAQVNLHTLGYDGGDTIVIGQRDSETVILVPAADADDGMEVINSKPITENGYLSLHLSTLTALPGKQDGDVRLYNRGGSAECQVVRASHDPFV